MQGLVFTSSLTGSAPRSAPPAARPVVSPVFLPREHGSWSLALEPIALGLLVARSPAGGALAATALAGFFARRPLKTFLAAGPAGARRATRVAVVMLSALIVAGFLEVLVLGGPTGLWPLLLAAPFGLLFVWFDAQNDSRAAAAELAGCTAFAFLPAALATLAGWAWPAALGLSAVALTRSISTVLTIRSYLRQRKGRPATILIPAGSAVAALVVVGLLARWQLVPGLVVGLATIHLGFTLYLVGRFRPVWTARRAGIFAAGLGLAYVAVAGAAYQLP